KACDGLSVVSRDRKYQDGWIRVAENQGKIDRMKEDLYRMWKSKTHLEKTLEDTNNELQKYAHEITSLSRQEIVEIKSLFYWLELVIILVVILVFIIISLTLTKGILPPLSRATRVISKLSKGERVSIISNEVDRRDEIGELQISIKRMLSNSNEIVTMAKRIAKGNYESNLIPRSPNDELAISLIEMSHALRKYKETADERYHEVVEGTDNLITQVDKNGNFIWVNRIGKITYGLSADKLIGLSAFKFVYPGDLSRTEEWFSDCSQKLKPQSTIENQQINLETGDVTFWLWTSHFIYDENKVFKGANSIAHNITERKLSEKLLQASLKEKQTLLDEIHHRVKNNMNVIASLLKLQLNKKDKKDVDEILKENIGRVYSMAAIHESLHQSEKLSDIDFKAYLHKLSQMLIQTYSVDPGKVAFQLDTPELNLAIDIANPLGLVLNELISNSLKYAFPDEQKGTINIQSSLIDEETIGLIVADDGIGMPDGFDWRKSDSLGLKLVQNLVENQLGGSIELDNKNGTKFTINFNLESNYK
ncbi:PAS domain S-box protein, partial [bacterium]|nr:PAS domain S-box protein [bacterium]